jgi:hypothetical protein
VKLLEQAAGELYQPGERVRKEGGGRKKLEEHYPGVEAAVERIADPKGNPESPLRWTSYSMEHIAELAQAEGYPISGMGVYRILKTEGFALKANKKEVEGKSNHPDRNAQFEVSSHQIGAGKLKLPAARAIKSANGGTALAPVIRSCK